MKLLLSLVIGVFILSVSVLLGWYISEKCRSGTELSFHAFNGSGIKFKIRFDSDIATFDSRKVYSKKGGDELNGGGYDIIYTFRGVKPGETIFRVEKRSAKKNKDYIYTMTVDEQLKVKIEELTVDNLDRMTITVPSLVVKSNGKTLYASLEDNPSARDFVKKLSTGSITVEMDDYGNFEKVGELPWKIKRSDREITAVPGDIILYEGNKITIYYDQNSWNFTRLGRLGNKSTREQMLEFLGEGKTSVSFSIEWSE